MDDEDEITMLTSQLNKYRTELDQLSSKILKQSTSLEASKDEVRDLELESKRPNLEDSPQTRKIRHLENSLDKAMIKYNEAQSIRKTYEEIVKRLGEERTSFDNQLGAIERTLGAKNHDYEELVLLGSDANHAKELTGKELERVRGTYEEERRSRDRTMKEKQQVVQVKMEMQARLEKREKAKQDVISQAAGDLSEDENNALKASRNLSVTGEEKREHRTKIDIFETAFRQIKEATGVSDVNEVIQKLFNQEGTTENLMSVTRENQVHVEAMQKQQVSLKALVEELKYSGSGGGQRRKMVDDHEESLNVSTLKLDRVRVKYERISKILVAVKAGVTHLADKVDAMGDMDAQVTDENIVDILLQTEQALLRLLTPLKANHVVLHAPKSPDATQKKTELLGFNDSIVSSSRPYNQRIPLPISEAMDEHGVYESSMGGAEDIDDALSRDKVKKASSQILISHDKKKKITQKSPKKRST